MKKILLLFLSLVLLTGILSSCSSKKSEQGSSKQSAKDRPLVYASDFEYDNINPILGSSAAEMLLFRGLMKFDEHNKPQPEVAESFEKSADGLTYTFKIKKGIKFHDGVELTAKDAAFTIETILDKKTASEIQPEYSEINGTKVVNDYELKVFVKKPFPALLDKLTVGIVPKHILQGKDIQKSDFNHKPIGNGPYKLEKWDKGKGMVFTAFDDFYGTKPSIKKVIFNYVPDGNVRAMQLETGEADLAYIEPSQLEKVKKNKKVNLHIVETADYRTLMYNFRNDIWKDVKVRQAFNYAVDREGVVKGILKGNGFPAYSSLQLNEFKNDQVKKYDFNLTKANQLLDEAGWKKEKDGFRYKNGKKLAFNITAPNDDEVRVNIATYLAKQFEKVGAEVKPEALDWSVIDISKCDTFVLGWGSPFDADDHTFKLFHSAEITNGFNFGQYVNKDVDALLEKGRTTTDPNERKKAYMELQEKLAEDPAFNYIAYLKAIYAVNKRVDGIKERTLGHHGSGFLWNIEEWKIND